MGQAKKTVIIAGGGTGGHLYPGVAIARALQKKSTQVKILFVGTRQGLETRIIPQEGFPLEFLSVDGLARKSLLGKLKTLCMIPFSLIQSLMILMREKPIAVLGVGGYSSGPFLLISQLCGFRTYYWEANAYPGMANRILSYIVSNGFLVFEEAKKYLRSRGLHVLGYPVRAELHGEIKSPRQPMQVLIFGGSQGARGINDAVCGAFDRYEKDLDGMSFILQTGKVDFPRISEKLKNRSNIQVREYLPQIQNEFNWADLVVCRAGAGTVSEVVSCSKAAVFVPFPFATDNHQQKNAEVLVKAQAAEMVLQRDFTPEKLIEVLKKFKSQPNLLTKYQTKISTLKREGSAEKIAEVLLG